MNLRETQASIHPQWTADLTMPKMMSTAGEQAATPGLLHRGPSLVFPAGELGGVLWLPLNISPRANGSQILMPQTCPFTPAGPQIHNS